MEFETIQFFSGRGIGEIVLNTPHNFNAFDHEKYQDIQAALKVCAEDDDIRVVVLRANGKAFSGGGDILDMKQRVDSQNFDTQMLCSDSLNIVRMLRTLPKPVIASVHGAVAGSGFVIALSCDLLLAEEKAKFYLPFVNIGLIPDASGMYTLTRALGTNRAVAKAMMGEHFTAREGVELGFVYRCCLSEELEKETQAVARKLACGPTKAYAGLKELAYPAPTTGTPCLAAYRVRWSWTRRVCRPCASWEKTWHGCSKALAETERLSHLRLRRKRSF